MAVTLSTLFIVTNLIVVLALASAPFIFFSVYAEESQNVWTITIPDGSSDQIQLQSFYPDELPILVGDTIVWENKDSVTHSVTSGLPKYPEESGSFFYPGKVESGNSVSHVLTNKEFTAFYYFCEIHPWMTGKIFVEDAPIALPETERPIETEKQSYSYGDSINISGQVHEDFAGTDYQLLIYDQRDNLIELSSGSFDEDATYSQTSIAEGATWNTNGKYHAKLVYALPSKAALTSFEFSKNALTSTESPLVPIWIKNIGDFWCKGQIDDSEFVGAIQYLIKEDIIMLEQKLPNSGTSEHIPAWIRNNACWWADGKIPDVDFVSGIQFLVNIGSIKV